MVRIHFAVAVFIFSPMCWGITLDQARRETEQARQNLEAIDRAIGISRGNGQRADRDLEDARRRQNDLSQRIDIANSTLSAQKERLTVVQKTIPDARAAADSARNAIAPKQTAIATGAKQLEAAQAGVVQTGERLWKQYLSTDPGAQAAVEKQSAAQAKLDAAVAAVLDALEKSPAFAQALATAAANEEKVKALRAGKGDAQQLADASTVWMRSKNEIEKLKESALAKDPAVQAARTELQSANAVLAAIKSAFDRNLAGNPEMSQPLASVQAETAALAGARADLKTAQTAATAAEARVKEATAAESAAKASLVQVDRDVAGLRRDLATAQNDQRDADQRGRQAQTDQDRLVQDRNRAQQMLRVKQDQEARVARTGK